MLELKALTSLVRSLERRHFDVATDFSGLGHRIEAIRLFDDGHYFLFSGSLQTDAPMSLEIFSNGFIEEKEFSVHSNADVLEILLFCDKYQEPFGW